MKRTTIMLSDDLDASVRHEAARRGATIAEVVREALEQHVGTRRDGRRELRAAGAGASGHTDTPRRIEEILREEGLGSR